MAAVSYSQTVGRLDGWTVGRLDGWTVGRLDGWRVGMWSIRGRKRSTTHGYAGDSIASFPNWAISPFWLKPSAGSAD